MITVVHDYCSAWLLYLLINVIKLYDVFVALKMALSAWVIINLK